MDKQHFDCIEGLILINNQLYCKVYRLNKTRDTWILQLQTQHIQQVLTSWLLNLGLDWFRKFQVDRDSEWHGKTMNGTEYAT